MSKLEIVLEYLPITLRKEIISNIGTEENKIEEIRLRSNKRLCLKIGTRNGISRIHSKSARTITNI